MPHKRMVIQGYYDFSKKPLIHYIEFYPAAHIFLVCLVKPIDSLQHAACSIHIRPMPLATSQTVAHYESDGWGRPELCRLERPMHGFVRHVLLIYKLMIGHITTLLSNQASLKAH